MTWFYRKDVLKSKKAKWLFIFLTAALWKATAEREPKALARKQLSFRFGQFPIGSNSDLDDFF